LSYPLRRIVCMFEREGTPICDPQGPIDNPFLFGFMGRTRTRQIDARSLNDHVLAAWQQFQEAEVRLAAAVAALDDRDTWRLEGALSPTAWLKHRLGIGHGHAVLLLKLARGLWERVELADAVVDGELSIDKARQILERFTKPRAAYAERDIDMLIEHANRLSVNDCKLFMAAWAARVDAEIESMNPEPPKPDDAERDPTSELYISEIADGQVIVNGSLAPVLGETFRTAIELARKLVRGENPDDVPVDNETIEDATPGPAEPKPPVEDRPDDNRNRAEERADALELIVRFFLDRNGTIDENTPPNRPDVHIEVNLDVASERVGGIASARYANYGFSVADVRRLLCDCNITRIVTNSASEILDVGRKTRTISKALRKAIRKRDRRCRMPGCDVRADYTEVHHGTHWANGGTTDLLNCFLLCYRHHRMMHSKDQPWTVQGDANGALTFIAPNGDHYCSAPPTVLC
jgi:Domain of unknown function (DUF222)/HNH endonuclease